MPQFNLARAALQQNLIPGIGDSNISTGIICVILFAIAFGINVLYESESGKGVKLFDRIIKVLVGLIVLSFFAVIITLTMSGTLDWGRIFKGLIPAPSLLFSPSPDFKDLIAISSNPEWWTQKIVNDQRDIIITAFGTAVGINMTWLLPYSLLKKKWAKRERGLAIFDLSLGLFIPFFLATSCVVIAAATQFHASTEDVFDRKGGPIPQFVGDYDKNLSALLKETPVEGAIREDKSIDYALISEPDRKLAGMLLKRDNFQLATTLEPLAGPVIFPKNLWIRRPRNGRLHNHHPDADEWTRLSGAVRKTWRQANPSPRLHRFRSRRFSRPVHLDRWSGSCSCRSNLRHRWIAHSNCLLYLPPNDEFTENSWRRKTYGWQRGPLECADDLRYGDRYLWLGLDTFRKGQYSGMVGILILATLFVIGSLGFYKNSKA